MLIPTEIDSILKTLNQNGYEAHIVGGCVRDMLMSIPPHDYDITTSAEPEDIISLFDKTIPTGIKHGTVTVIKGDFQVEVTTYRTEGKYENHRKPCEVTFVKNLYEDLSRRDFTVNAICYNTDNGITDFFEGRRDIENKILRTVGNPEKRFTEDALRILRLFRFSATLEFEIEKETERAALKTAHLLNNISAERISTELIKTLNGKNPAALKPLTDINQIDILRLNTAPDYEKVKLLAPYGLALFTFLYSGSADIVKTLAALKLSNKEKANAENLLYLLTLPFPVSKAIVKEMLFKTNTDTFFKYLKFNELYLNKNIEKADTMLSEILNNKEPYKISDLKISGRDLNEIGISGRKTGETLEALRKAVVCNPKLNTKEKLLEIVKI